MASGAWWASSRSPTWFERWRATTDAPWGAARLRQCPNGWATGLPAPYGTGRGPHAVPTTPSMRYFQALDPRRSLATSFAWLAVALSLATALALLVVGDFAANSMLAQRDALMTRFASEVGSELEKALKADRAAVLRSPAQFVAAVDRARAR